MLVFQVGVKITLASTGLTKIITFTPYYMLVNKAPVTLSVKETLDTAGWCDLPAGEVSQMDLFGGSTVILDLSWGPLDVKIPA